MLKSLALKHLSIQQRLPLFICILLLFIIVTFSWVSYLGVKNASLQIGNERVTTLVEKLAAMLKDSLTRLAIKAEQTAGRNDIKSFLLKDDLKSKKSLADFLKSYRTDDTSCTSIQILDKSKRVILNSGDSKILANISFSQLIDDSAKHGHFPLLGKLVRYKGLLFFPVIAEVKDAGQVLGYVVNWHFMRNTQKSVDQLTQLLGGNGKLYLGNDDGQFWTDLINPVSAPGVSLENLQSAAHYKRQPEISVIGSARNISGTRWLILVELSSTALLQTAQLFLNWVIVIGLILVVGGSIGVWFMTRSITAPLNQLNEAASSIAAGNYDALVNIRSRDELGKLAVSFNIMAEHVRSAQNGLERKVEDRNQLLETAITDIFDQKENEKRKDEFISIASHELKTPLTTIKAFFQLATKDIDPGYKSFRFIDKASRQLTRMERLIEDLLDVSKINSGKMQYNLEYFDFHTALVDAVESVQGISPTHQFLLKQSVDLTIYGDRHRIEQVIINLLNNAVKYSPDAQEVVISAALNHGQLCVTIKDRGIGIPEAHLNALFERFYRVDTQHRFQGLGLGLFISSEIVKRHGGRILVESKPGEGAAFTFQLPLAYEEMT